MKDAHLWAEWIPAPIQQSSIGVSHLTIRSISCSHLWKRCPVRLLYRTDVTTEMDKRSNEWRVWFSEAITYWTFPTFGRILFFFFCCCCWRIQMKHDWRGSSARTFSLLASYITNNVKRSYCSFNMSPVKQTVRYGNYMFFNLKSSTFSSSLLFNWVKL